MDSFNLYSAAGRHIILSFFGSGSITRNAEILREIGKRLGRFLKDDNFLFLGISIDPEDEKTLGERCPHPKISYLWDFDQSLSALYGAISPDQADRDSGVRFRTFTLVLDPALLVIASIPATGAEPHATRLESILNELSFDQSYAEDSVQAPVLVVPRIFEPELCRDLIDLYKQRGGSDSGFMREQEGKTVGVVDHRCKRRRDLVLDNVPELEIIRSRVRDSINHRLRPQILKAFQFRVTRMERYLVACYDAAEQGFFAAHRDNTTKGTEHRRFACTINLNASEYEGGLLCFPEFGARTYRAPTGGAVVFSCSLLHEATAVTKGTRYAFLPFFYDDAAAAIREANLKFVSA